MYVAKLGFPLRIQCTSRTGIKAYYGIQTEDWSKRMQEVFCFKVTPEMRKYFNAIEANEGKRTKPGKRKSVVSPKGKSSVSPSSVIEFVGINDDTDGEHQSSIAKGYWDCSSSCRKRQKPSKYLATPAYACRERQEGKIN